MQLSPISNHPGQKAMWTCGTRFGVACAGRRFGKTRFAIEKLCYSSQTPKGLFWYVAPTRDQAKDLLWDELKERMRELKWKYDKDETSLTLAQMGLTRMSDLRGQ